MTDNTDPLVALSVLALELPQTADELAARFADELVIADELGRKSVPASVARELIAAEAQRQYDAAEAKRRRQAAMHERIRERRRRNPIPRGVRQTLPEGTLPVQAMTAASNKQYDGGVYRPVPTHLDWAFGNAEGGATIGPSKAELAAQAKARASNAAQQRRGAK